MRTEEERKIARQIARKKYKLENKEKVRAQYLEYNRINKDSRNKKAAIYREANREKVNTASRIYARNNKEKLYEYAIKFKEANRGLVNSWAMKRHCAKLQRTPPWLSTTHLREIQHIYTLSAQLTKETGVVHHVDHIVPLQGETVSGLHVPWNLRAIPFYENCSKSNKLLEL